MILSAFEVSVRTPGQLEISRVSQRVENAAGQPVLLVYFSLKTLILRRGKVTTRAIRRLPPGEFIAFACAGQATRSTEPDFLISCHAGLKGDRDVVRLFTRLQFLVVM